MSEREPIIRCRDLTVGYGREVVLRGVDLDVPRGAFLPFVGPNGAGKTTLPRAILGLLRPLEGSIETPFHHAPPGYVPQQKAIDPRHPLSAEQIALMGLYPRLGWWRRPGAADRRRLDGIFGRLGLDEHRRKTFGELSGGTKQKVLIARALMGSPELLILDEACAGLDLRTREHLLETIEDLAARGDITLIFVTHHIEEITPAFSHVLILDDGAAAAQGPKAKVLTGEILSAAMKIDVGIHRQGGRFWPRIAGHGGVD